MNRIIGLSKKLRTLIGIDLDWSEHKENFGSLNPDDTFYVIRRNDRQAGINSYFNVNLGHIRYAVNHGWIPIIDMQNYPNAYLEDDERGRLNAWDFYYNQPYSGKYSLEEVYKSRNVILSSWEVPRARPDDSMDFLGRFDIIEMWHKYFIKYVGFSVKLLQETDRMYEKYFRSEGKTNERILGVSLRGTDYLMSKPYEHPVQPTIAQALDMTYKVMEEQRCEWIYLATEDVHILDAYIKEFDKKVIYIRETQMYGTLLSAENVTSYSFNRKNDKYLRGMEYMVQKVLLTKCNCFIGGRTSGNVAVLVWQPYYDYTYLWNLGRYGIDDEIDEV